MAAVRVQDRAYINQGGVSQSSYADTWPSQPGLGNKVTYKVIVNSYPGTAGPVTITATDNAVTPNIYTVSGVASNAGSMETVAQLAADIKSLPTSGNLITTISYTRGGVAIACYSMITPTEWSGLVPGAADQQAVLSNNALTGTTVTTGPTGALFQSQELVETCYSCDSQTTTTGMSIPTDCTLLGGGINQDDSDYIAWGSAFKIVNALAGVSAAWGASTNASGFWNTGSVVTYLIAQTPPPALPIIGRRPLGRHTGLKGLIARFMTPGAPPQPAAVASAVTAALTGVSSTTSVSSTSLGVGVNPTASGVSSTTSPGTVAPGVSVALTGVSSTTSVGTVSAGPPILGAVTSTGSVGTAAVLVQLALSGVSSTTSPGTVAPGTSVVLASVTSTGSLGTAAANVQLNLSGVSSTTSPGSVTPSVAPTLSGTSTTTSVTAPGVSVTVALSGVSSTTSVGTVVGPGLALTAVSSTTSVGSVTPSVTKALTGNSSTTSPGTVISTPTKALSGNSATGSVGTVVFGNVVVKLSGVTTICTPGTVVGPIPNNTKDGERFFAEQMALPPYYQGPLPTPNQRGAMFFISGTWQVPLGATNVFVSATAGGGTPFGNAGAQLLQWALPVAPGDTLTVQFDPAGDVYVFDGGIELVYLQAGAAWGQQAWQNTWGQLSGLPGGFGSGVNAGIPYPPILVFYWN
jgi:hypothetical protein